MPIPQLTDRIKEAPAMMLRAIFAGVGQVLLAVDKIRGEVLDHGDQAKTGQPAATAAKAAAPPPAPQPAGEEPANVRVLREPARPPAEAPAPAGAREPAEAKPAAAEAAAKPTAAKPAAAKPARKRAAAKSAAAKPAAAEPAAAEPAAPQPPAAKPAGKGATARPATAKPAAAEKPKSPAATGSVPPLANYDELTIASLRARMRGLNAAGVRGLLAYEKSHANRETVVAMYERRLDKITSEAS